MDGLRGAARNLSSENEPWSARDQGFLLPASTWRDPPIFKPALPGDIGLEGRDAWMPRCQLAADLVGHRDAGVWNLDDSGVPTNKTNESPPNADGFAVDCAGNIIIQGTNSAFGGPDGKTLIVVSNPPNVKLVQMSVPGFP